MVKQIKIKINSTTWLILHVLAGVLGQKHQANRQPWRFLWKAGLLVCSVGSEKDSFPVSLCQPLTTTTSFVPARYSLNSHKVKNRDQMKIALLLHYCQHKGGQLHTVALPLSVDAQTYTRSLYDCDLRRLVALNNFPCTEICSSTAASLVIYLHLNHEDTLWSCKAWILRNQLWKSISPHACRNGICSFASRGDSGYSFTSLISHSFTCF